MADTGAALSAGNGLLRLLDEIDEAQLEIINKSKRLTTPLVGNIELKDITFKYPSREKLILENFNLSIKAG